MSGGKRLAEINEAQLRKQIKSGEPARAYLFYGEESYLKEYYVSQIREKTVDKAFETFNLHFFEGKDITLDDAVKDAQLLPLMCAYNLVIMRDYEFERISDVKLIEEYLSDCPETTVFILWYDAVEPDVKSAKFKRLIKAFSQAGFSVELQRRSDSDIAKLLVSGAKKRGALLDIGNARYLISVSGNDLKVLLNELDKLCGFACGGEITRDIIDDMATKCLQARIYDLSRYIVAGNADKAYGVLDTLLTLKEKPIDILATVTSVYVDMYRVKCAKAAGFAYDDVAKYYNYQRRAFALKNAARDCASLSREQLRSSLDAIADADIKMKSTAVDNKLLLEELIIKLLMTAGEH